MTATAAVNGSGILAIDAGGTCFKSAIIGGQGTLVAGSFYQVPAGPGNNKDQVIVAYEKIIRHVLGERPPNNSKCSFTAPLNSR